MITIGVPVPPYKGHPLDPPFRSRFQGRWVEGYVGHTGSADVAARVEGSRDPTHLAEGLELQKLFYQWGHLVREHNHVASGETGLPPTAQLPHLAGTAIPLIDETIAQFLPGRLPPAVLELGKDKDDTPTSATAANTTAESKLEKASSSGQALQMHSTTRAMQARREMEAFKRLANRPAPALVAQSTATLLGTGYPVMHAFDSAQEKLLADLLGAVGLSQGLGEKAAQEGVGLLGYRILRSERPDPASHEVSLLFEQIETGQVVKLRTPGGSLPLVPVPSMGETTKEGILVTPRMIAQLTLMLQLHAIGRDICLLPSSLAGRHSVSGQASSSTSTSIGIFASILGYPLETLHLFKDISGQELLMRRATAADGSTTWELAPLLKGAVEGRLVHLAGVDTLGPTLGSLARLATDRESELWNGNRFVLSHPDDETLSLGKVRQTLAEAVGGAVLPAIQPSFRVVATAAAAKGDWLDEESSTMFGFVQPSPMGPDEEAQVIADRSGCPMAQLEPLLDFAAQYRKLSADPNLSLAKSRRLGTRQLLRMAHRLAHFPDSDMHWLITRSLLVDFLPKAVRAVVLDLLAQNQIYPAGAEGAFQYRSPPLWADPEICGDSLVFKDIHEPSSPPDIVPLFDVDQHDPEGKLLVPTMKSFYDNPDQTALLKAMAEDLHILGEHLLLMGNQGTGKNKIVDRLLQLLRRPREYIQLHRDSTVSSILQQVQLKDGQLAYLESPLVRAIRMGRVMVIDEADKASAAVTAVFKSLAERGELSLPDGRRVRPASRHGSPDDILLHPDFRLILLSNRPGYPFLGNEFLQVIGEGFSCYAVSNPDPESEIRLLQQAAPDVPRDLLQRLDMAFHDLRQAFVDGLVAYPYSLRELLHLVRHLQNFPEEELSSVLLNTLAFDLHRPEAMAHVLGVLDRYGIDTGGMSLAAVREAAAAKAATHASLGKDGKAPPKLVQFDPRESGKETSLDKPKEGKIDPKNNPHVGGNTWRGGTGGRDTAGLGGRGGYERLYSGHDIHQVPQEMKDAVPEHVRKQAKEMALAALAKKLADEGLTATEGATLHAYQAEMAPQILALRGIFDALQASAHERQWLTRQQEGELDERRLADGLTGERNIFRRRQEQPPEPGAPQTKPKRLRFLVDLSASMYVMQFDGRLDREVKTVVMIMEAMQHADPGKFIWDVVGHNGDGNSHVLIAPNKPPRSAGDKWKGTCMLSLAFRLRPFADVESVLRDMVAYMQYTDSGDNTVSSFERSAIDLGKEEADSRFVIGMSDAHLSRYGITVPILSRALNKGGEKVRSAIIFIDKSGSEAQHFARALPGKAFVCPETKDMPNVLSSILTAFVQEE